MATEWKFIPIKGGLKAKVDAEDYDRVMKYSWRAIRRPSGRLTVVTSILTPSGNRQITLGKYIMNPPEGQLVYPRRFQDALDYRKENLMLCSMKERQQILPKSRNHGSSRFKGVSFVKSKNLWRAGIQVDGVSINLGEFPSEEEAAIAYNKAAAQHFGDRAHQNRLEYRRDRRRLKAA